MEVPLSFKRVLSVAALVLMAAGCLASPASGQAAAKPEEVSLLFAQTAPRGTLRPAEGEGRFTLTLRDVAPQVVWFTDRPARHTGHLPVRGFVNQWASFGFVEDPPNAALTLLGAHHTRDTVVLELDSPRYVKKIKGIRYSVLILDEASGNLEHYEDHRDDSIPEEFRSPSLFIDDVAAQYMNGCLIQAFTSCPGAHLEGITLDGGELYGAVLPGAFLAGARLQRADLTRANLRGVDLQGAVLIDAILRYVDLTDATLGGAYLGSAYLIDATLVRANFTGADLSRADLDGSNISGANFYHAYLVDADLSNTTGTADLTQAVLCRTRMPDGEIDNRDCDEFTG